jgi:tetratricopeptide (TPR) repeat protein
MSAALLSVELQLEKAVEIGYVVGRAIATQNKGGILRNLGRNPQAIKLCRRAVDLAREVSDRRVEGYALQEFALALEQAGESERAEKALEEALALREETRYLPGVASTHSELGRLLHAAGRNDEAGEHLRRAIEMAREQGANDVLALALARAATLPGGDVERALEAYRASEHLLEHVARIEVCHILGGATGDGFFLREARRLLSELEEHAPPAFRDSVRRHVPLFRAIGGGGGSHS